MYEKPFNPYSKNLAIVKDYFRRPSILIMGIVKALGAALTVAAAAIAALNITGVIGDVKTLIAQFCDMARLPAPSANEINSALDSARTSSSYFSVPASIPAAVVSALIALAFFIIFFKSRSSKPDASPSGGVAVLYVFAVIELIAVIIVAVAVILLFVFLFWIYFQMKASASESYVFSDIDFMGSPLKIVFEADFLLAMIIVGLAVSVVALFIVMFFVVSKKRYYGSVRASLSSVELHREGAKPYGVMCILKAVVSGLCLIIPVAVFVIGKGKLTALAPVVIVSAAAHLISLVINALDAKIALGYKKYIDEKKFGYNRHAASEAPYSPIPAADISSAPQNRPQNNPYVNPSASSAAPFGADDYPRDAVGTDNPYTSPAGASDDADDEKTLSYESSDGESPFADLFAAAARAEGDTDPVPEDTAEAYAQPTVDDAEPEADSETEAPAAPEPEEAGPAQDAPTLCPACGAEVDPDAAFCGNCGQKL